MQWVTGHFLRSHAQTAKERGLNTLGAQRVHDIAKARCSPYHGHKVLTVSFKK